MGFFDFSQLPEVSDFIKNPVFDKNLTDITSLVLKGQAIRNPLAGNLRGSIGNLNNAVSKVNEIQKKVEQSKKARQNFGFGGSGISGVLGPDGLGDSALGRSLNAAKSNPQLDAAMSALSAGKSKMISALGQANKMLDHSNLMTNNIPTVGGIINDAIATPSRFTSEVAGALPASFPSKMPAYRRGGGFPNFGGLSLPSIPNVDLPAVNLPAMPNVGALTGVSIPGIPNPTDVLEGFSGSLTGSGPGLASSMGSYASKMPELTSEVSDIVQSLNVQPLNALGDLASPLPPSIPSPANLAKLADFSAVTDGLGSLGGGMGSMVSGEQGGIFAAACSKLSLGGACGGLPSIADASGLASSLTSLAGTATTAQLVDSVATGPLKEKLANVAQGIVDQAGTLSPASAFSAAQGAVGDAISVAQTAGGGVIGGALASAASSQALQTARDLAGQGVEVVGGGIARGKDAITQAQTLASSSISAAQVAAKGAANSTVEAITEKIKGEDSETA